MGSPVVAILALVLGYTFIYSGVKNISIVNAFKGIETANPTTASSTDTTTASTPTATTTVGGETTLITNTQPVGTPRKAS